MISLLDKLVNEESDSTMTELQTTVPYDSICRDLENLLNTRKPELIWPPNFREINLSILNYGINSTARDLGNPLLQNKFCEELAQTIALFEPRLQRVKVTLQQHKPNLTQLHLRIEAMLTADAMLKEIVFNSIFEPGINIDFANGAIM